MVGGINISNNKPLESKFLKDIGRKADKMAAHLTEAGSRYSNKDKEWERIRIRDEINEKILGFLDAVPDDTTMSKKTKSEIRRIIAMPGPTGGASDSIRAVGIGATGPNGP